MRRLLVLIIVALVFGVLASTAAAGDRQSPRSPDIAPRRAALADRRWNAQSVDLPIRSAQARCQMQAGFTLCYGRECGAWFSNIPGKFWARYTDHILWTGQRIVVRPVGVTTISTAC